MSVSLSPALKIVTICGSIRRSSFNEALIKELPRLGPGEMIFDAAPPVSDIPLYDGDLERDTGIPGAVARMADLIREADGVIIVSPEYNASVPGPLKNALDWLSRVPNQPFSGMPLLIMSASAGPMGGVRMQGHLRQILVALSACVFTRPEIFIGSAASKFDENDGLTDIATRELVKAQLIAFAAFCKRLKG
jgi:chromate reductase